ncbi:class I SAM-dependent methyltransferase [Agromyces aerolatus]|uniref:class I SAM-dependent methyltransferase n=1 Tax=Agromyces sp. LY-1074 TaxID=3074080 RepID=UPI00285C5320|nr:MULTISPECIES: methyltransferase [unclassified Agromyces]MDR5701016.1 methyltransferase [Agromyces sp. LY-1074]MDR5707656.1 methyltransferase [Agromyces sp. LY-1358]
MPQEHYFSSSPAAPGALREIGVRLHGRDVRVVTAPAVFSPDHVDSGTQALLDAVPEPPAGGHLLDLGAGWGPMALTMAMAAPDATVWALDVNERALDLVRRNAERLGLGNVNAVLAADVPADVTFAAIWSNPPIRVGKAVLHALMHDWLPRLDHGSSAWLVVQKHLGADSFQRWLGSEFEQGYEVSRAASSKGFRLLEVARD